MKFKQRIMANQLKVGDTVFRYRSAKPVGFQKPSGSWRKVAQVLCVGSRMVIGLENPNDPPLCMPLHHKVEVMVDIKCGVNYILGSRDQFSWDVGTVMKVPRKDDSMVQVQTAQGATIMVPYKRFRCEAKPDALQYLYARYLGMRCMYCCTYDIEVTGTRSAEGYVVQAVRCNLCHATWEDCLTLTRVVRGELPKGLVP